MNTVERRVRAMINPMSTAFTRWWCHSAVDELMTSGLDGDFGGGT